MARARIARGETTERNIPFSALHVEMRNADLILLSEGEDQLGTLAVAVPQERGRLGPPLSSVLLGERNMLLARLLAERLAEKSRKITLVSVFVKAIGETEAGPILLKLVDKTIQGEGKP